MKLTGWCQSTGWLVDDPVIPRVLLYLGAIAVIRSTVGRGSHSSWGPLGSHSQHLTAAECWAT